MKLRLWPLCAATALLCASQALAKPPGPANFCIKYPTSQVCTGLQPTCAYCHSSPPSLNEYGTAISTKLAPSAPRPLSDGDDVTGLPAALTAVEALDSDADGVSNLVEIQKGTLPGDKKSYPNDIPCAGGANPSFSVCKYDYRYVYRKVLLDFCGTSPTYDALDAFMKLNDADKQLNLDVALDNCLATEFWRGKNGQLWQLAHKKIRPVGSLHASAQNPKEEEGLAPLADYYDDYALWTWSQIDDHDARDVLTANFFVARTTTAPTKYTLVTTLPIQGVDLPHRAGNLTSAWTLVYNVMFTALPRNAAAQAYRGYLGLDIAKQEGLYAVANEPKDYDGKGVTQPLCTQCHATLDPLSYPFRNYNGLTGPNTDIAQYIPMRIEKKFSGEAPNITQIPEQGYIFNQPVSDLVHWAQVAANSDAFLVATVNDYWKLLNGQAPLPEQNAEFTTLWKRLKTPNNYRVQKMLHELIRTEAYGAP